MLLILIPILTVLLLPVNTNIQFCETISANIDLTTIREQHGKSVGKSCSSSNPLAQSSFSHIASIYNLSSYNPSH